MLAGLAAVLFAGCMSPQGDSTLLPRQDEAVKIIWRDNLQQTKDPPIIFWRRDVCNTPNGPYGVLPYCTFENAGEKEAGIETSTDQWVEVGAPSDGFAISDTALAHELLHAAIGDPDHLSPQWQTINSINAQLKAHGL